MELFLLEILLQLVGRCLLSCSLEIAAGLGKREFALLSLFAHFLELPLEGE